MERCGVLDLFTWVLNKYTLQLKPVIIYEHVLEQSGE